MEMNPDTSRSRHGVLQRGVRRLLDGARPWGSVEIRPGRFGIVSYRLVVYPPGLNRTQLRGVRLVRGWPLWGMVLWLVCQIGLSGTMSPWGAFGVSTAVIIGSLAGAAAMAGEARTRVRTMDATTMVGYDDPAALAARDRLGALAATLVDADELLVRGEICPVDHELIWWRVYDRLQDEITSSHRAG